MLRNGTAMEFGILRRCVLNNLPNFHVLINFIVDVMHDLMLGVLKYDIKAILQHYTLGDLLELDDLNTRIKKWNFGCKETIRITPLKKSYLSDTSTVQMNAKEVWFFVENLPFLLRDLVPDDEYFNFVLMMHDLLDVCLQPEFGCEEFFLLDLIIKQHHRFYKEQLRGSITPKFHFLIHYAEVVRRCGPLKDLMCFRLEAKHQELKSYSNVSHNRKNVCLSLANKQMYKFADFILNFKPECLNFVSSIKKIKPSLFDGVVFEAVKHYLLQNERTFTNLICAERVVYKGTTFAKGEYLVIDEDSAALISGVIVADSHVIILYHVCTIFYEDNLRSYSVLEEDNNMVFYDFIDSFKYIPVPSNLYGAIPYIKKIKRY